MCLVDKVLWLDYRQIVFFLHFMNKYWKYINVNVFWKFLVKNLFPGNVLPWLIIGKTSERPCLPFGVKHALASAFISALLLLNIEALAGFMMPAQNYKGYWLPVASALADIMNPVWASSSDSHSVNILMNAVAPLSPIKLAAHPWSLFLIFAELKCCLG